MAEVCYKVVLGVGAIGGLLGAWLIYLTLRANHDWSRRKQAIDMLEAWNQNVYPHFRTIEQVFPHIRHFDHGEKKYTELTRDKAKELWACDPDSADLWRVKIAFLELLNYFEMLTAAYTHKVADRAIIDQSIKNALVQWHDILIQFIKVAEEGLGFQPWQPYLDVVAKWKAPRTTERGRTA